MYIYGMWILFSNSRKNEFANRNPLILDNWEFVMSKVCRVKPGENSGQRRVQLAVREHQVDRVAVDLGQEVDEGVEGLVGVGAHQEPNLLEQLLLN